MIFSNSFLLLDLNSVFQCLLGIPELILYLQHYLKSDDLNMKGFYRGRLATTFAELVKQIYAGDDMRYQTTTLLPFQNNKDSFTKETGKHEIVGSNLSSSFPNHSTIKNPTAAITTHAIPIPRRSASASLEYSQSLPSVSPLSSLLSSSSSSPVSSTSHSYVNSSGTKRYNSSILKKSSFSVMALRELIQEKKTDFGGVEQQDAHECLCAILEGLQEDLSLSSRASTPVPLPLNSDSNNDTNDMSNKNNSHPSIISPLSQAAAAAPLSNPFTFSPSPSSMLSDLFIGTVVSEIRCSSCNHFSVKHENFTQLTLPIPALHIEPQKRTNSRRSAVASGYSTQPKECSLEDCLYEFGREELLTREYRCANCTLSFDSSNTRMKPSDFNKTNAGDTTTTTATMNTLSSLPLPLSSSLSSSSSSSSSPSTSLSSSPKSSASSPTRLPLLDGPFVAAKRRRLRRHPESQQSIHSSLSTNTSSINSILIRPFSSLRKHGRNTISKSTRTTTIAFKQCRITSLPSVLVFHLNRFIWDNHQRCKIGTVVSFPLNQFEFPSSLLEGGNENHFARWNGHRYHLFAVCAHIGDLKGGHYITYRRDVSNSAQNNSGSDGWWMLDDDRVEWFENGPHIWRLLEMNAYMLFYKRN